MARFGRNRKWVYLFLVQRDGERCIYCGVSRTGCKSLDIDHVDDDPFNNDPENLRLSCHQCNSKLRSTSLSEHKRLAEINCASHVCETNIKELALSAEPFTKDGIDYLNGSPEMQANAIYEPGFRDLIMRLIKTQGNLTWDDAQYAGAEELKCSPETTNRYLKKLTSGRGPLVKMKDVSGRMVIKQRGI